MKSILLFSAGLLVGILAATFTMREWAYRDARRLMAKDIAETLEELTGLRKPPFKSALIVDAKEIRNGER